MHLLPLLLAVVSTAQAASLDRLPTRQSNAVTVVNINNGTGAAVQRASGMTYGVPLRSNQIPDVWYQQFGLRYVRSGGTCIGAGGWNIDFPSYQARFRSMLSNYKTSRKHGANYTMLVTDLWGNDGCAPSNRAYPYQNWTSYDAFVKRLIKDIKSHNMIPGLTWDIWNEPDLGYAWNGTQADLLNLWGRTYPVIRSSLPGVSIDGPSTSGSPGTYNSWWVNFVQYVKQNNCWPDQWAWHMEPGDGDISSTYGNFVALLGQYGVPVGRININEYATPTQQNPVWSAWFIAQLERIDAYGLRGIWLPAAQVYDLFTGILPKTDANNAKYKPNKAGYFPNGEFQVYKYYTLNMTGTRVGTLPSSDHTTEVFATVDSTARLRMLYGSRGVTGSSSIQVNDLTGIGLPASGSLVLTIYGFPYYGGAYQEIDNPTSFGTHTFTYSGNSLTFPVYPGDGLTAYAFEIQGIA